MTFYSVYFVPKVWSGGYETIYEPIGGLI